MSTCSSQGAVSKLAIGGYQMPFRYIDDQSYRAIVDDTPEMITGLMDPLSERISLGQQFLTVMVRLHPTPLELTQLLPYMGLALSTGVWQLEEDVDDFTMVIDRVAKVHTYSNCKINQWVLGGQKGQPITLDLQIFGKTFSEGSAGSFSATALQSDAPYPFTGATYTIKSSARAIDRLAFAVNHNLEREFENALTANCIDMTRRTATVASSVPYISGNTALFTTPFVTSLDGAAATLLLARGNQSTSIAFTNLTPIARPPSIPAKVAIRLPMFHRAYRTISDKAFAITHDDSV